MFLIWPAPYPESEGSGVHGWRVPPKSMGRQDLGRIPAIPSGSQVGMAGSHQCRQWQYLVTRYVSIEGWESGKARILL